jgi:hypothetical protein
MDILCGLQLTQAVLYARGQSDKALLQLFQHLARILIRSSAHGGRITLSQIKQALALSLDSRQQSLLLQHITHMRLCLANQPLLLADHTAGLLQLLRHRHAHPVDNVQNALFIHQQPATKKDSPPFGQRIFEFID